MPTLMDRLSGPATLDDVHRDCVEMIERFVATRKSPRGLAMKAGLLAARAIGSDTMVRVAEQLLPDCAKALDPLYQEQKKLPRVSFADYLIQHQDRAIAALLEVVDRQAKSADHRAVRMFYSRLRTGAEREGADLIPHIALLFSRYV